MRIILIFCLMVACLCGCIEPYAFLIEDKKPALVVEGFISNISFEESVDFPSDGRFFSIRLRFTSNVTNQSDPVVANAMVSLLSDAGEQWYYTPSASRPGEYVLEDPAFEAQPGQKYKLQIMLANDETYESSWEQLPQPAPAPMGAISFEETVKQIYTIVAGERQIKNVKGVAVFINVAKNAASSPVYYKWDFTPHWIYSAPLTGSSQPNYRCWATAKDYLAGYTLQLDNVGGYKKELFFMETEGNARIFEDFSVLIRQQAMSESFYYFWKEMKDQAEGGVILDSPPYNLQSNFKAVNGDQKVFGYFGVVDEKASRWYFSKAELSYWVENNLKEECQKNYGRRPGDKAPACFDCREYDKGIATTQKPIWWHQK